MEALATFCFFAAIVAASVSFGVNRSIMRLARPAAVVLAVTAAGSWLLSLLM
jgi:hypothetical protein